MKLRPARTSQESANSYGNGWHEWTDATGFWQRHLFPEGDDYCWCGTYIPWRASVVIEANSERRSG